MYPKAKGVFWTRLNWNCSPIVLDGNSKSDRIAAGECHNLKTTPYSQYQMKAMRPGETKFELSAKCQKGFLGTKWPGIRMSRSNPDTQMPCLPPRFLLHDLPRELCSETHMHSKVPAAPVGCADYNQNCRVDWSVMTVESLISDLVRMLAVFIVPIWGLEWYPIQRMNRPVSSAKASTPWGNLLVLNGTRHKCRCLKGLRHCCSDCKKNGVWSAVNPFLGFGISM